MLSATRKVRGPLAACTVLTIASAGPSLASNTTYAYDANGRLVSSTRTVGLTEQYGFDNADNRSSLSTSRQGSGNNPTVAHAGAQPATTSIQATTAPAQAAAAPTQAPAGPSSSQASGPQ